MLKFLVPVDGSESSSHTIDHVVKRLGWCKDDAEVHLLNVQRPIPGGSAVAAHIGQDALRRYHHDEGMKALGPSMQKLDAAGIHYIHHISVGEPAEVIMQFANQTQPDEIIMGTRGLGAPANLLLGSVASKVIQLADRPVLLVK
jgi:nucleotide-binding universal stress UspA family protein